MSNTPSLESLANKTPEKKPGETTITKTPSLESLANKTPEKEKKDILSERILANINPTQDPLVDVGTANDLITNEIAKLSKIIQAINTEGGKIHIYKDQNGNCYIKYDEYLYETKKGYPFVELSTEPDVFANLFKTDKQYSSILFKKSGGQLQYNIEEVPVPEQTIEQKVLNQSWYLLYQEEIKVESEIKFPMQILNTKTRFDQLFKRGFNSYLALNEAQKQKLIVFITEIDKNGETKIDLKTILELLKNVRILVHNLYSSLVPEIFSKETPQHPYLKSLETNLQSLIFENKKLENIVNDVLNIGQVQIKKDKTDDDWYSFIKTMNDFKTEFFNSILDVIILLKSTEAERMEILKNNNEQPKNIPKSIFESTLVEYITNLEEFIKNVISELKNSKYDYAFESADDKAESDDETESDDDEGKATDEGKGIDEGKATDEGKGIDEGKLVLEDIENQ